MNSIPAHSASTTAPRLLDQVRGKIRLKHYSLRTEQTYVEWIKRFILHHGKRHPRDMGATEVEAFLTDLAVRGRVAASTQNQAKSALLFMVIGDVPRLISRLAHSNLTPNAPLSSVASVARLTTFG